MQEQENGRFWSVSSPYCLDTVSFLFFKIPFLGVTKVVDITSGTAESFSRLFQCFSVVCSQKKLDHPYIENTTVLSDI